MGDGLIQGCGEGVVGDGGVWVGAGEVGRMAFVVVYKDLLSAYASKARAR
jgi:hypothetical protein